MKKTLFLSCLLSGLLLGGSLALGQGSPMQVKAEQASSEPVTYIPFEDANFTSEQWTEEGRTTASEWRTGSYGTFWGFRYFNALDDFYDGNIQEGWTGTISSIPWVQYEETPYVTFTLGGNVNGESYLEIVDEEGNNATTIEGGKIYNEKFNDPDMSVNMIVKVVKIAPEYFGKPIHLKIHDNKTGGFGMVEFGRLSPNQSAQDVTDMLWAHGFGGQGNNHNRPSTSAAANSNFAAQEKIWGIYTTDPTYSVFMDEAIKPTKTEIVEDFESGVLSPEWVLDGNYGYENVPGKDQTDNWVYPGYDRDRAVSDRVATNYEWIPFNKDGKYFLNGWNDEGGAAVEHASYRLLSRPFVLTGSGLIGAKLGGRTAQLSLYAYDGDKPTVDETPLASLRLPFNGCVDITNGLTNVTMRRAYLDASGFVGKTVVLALEDCEAGMNWGHAMFDSIDTNVDLNGFKFAVDVLAQKRGEEAATTHAAITDYYKAGASKGDLAYVEEAYDFLLTYYGTARSKESLYTYCELPLESLSAIVSAYEGLSESEQAKAIVDGSGDYSYSGYLDHKDEIVYEDEIVLTTVGVSMGMLEALMAKQQNAVNGIVSVNQSGDGLTYAVVAILALVSIVGVSVSVYLFLRKGRISK